MGRRGQGNEDYWMSGLWGWVEGGVQSIERSNIGRCGDRKGEKKKDNELIWDKLSLKYL